jgi:hypothetical protein
MEYGTASLMTRAAGAGSGPSSDAGDTARSRTTDPDMALRCIESVEEVVIGQSSHFFAFFAQPSVFCTCRASPSLASLGNGHNDRRTVWRLESRAC